MLQIDVLSEVRRPLGQSVTPASRTSSRNGTKWHNFKRVPLWGVCLGLLLACGRVKEGNGFPAHSTTTGGGGPTSDGSGPASDGSGPTSGGSGPTSGGGGSPTTGGNLVVTGGDSPDCPSVQPAAASSCAIEGLGCRYNNCVAPNYWDNAILICEEGAWDVVGTEACMSPDECPPYVTLGDACGWEGWQGSLGPCNGSNACGQYQAYCIDGSWQLRADDPAPGAGGEGGADGTAPSTSATTSPPPVPQCPTFPPFQGNPCCPSDVPAYCDYSELSSESVSATQTVSSAVGGPAGTVGGAFSLFCAECSPSMFWIASDACP